MQEIDWTVVLAASVTGGGLLTAIFVAIFQRTKPKVTKPDAERAAQEALSTTSLDGKALEIAQDALAQAQHANQRAEAANERADGFQARLTIVEDELNLFRRSYRNAYWWIQWVRGPDWDRLREDPNPPPGPDGIHHPETP